MSHKYVLYYAPDNASLIIRLALDEMGLPFDTVLVDRFISAQKDPSYLALNPAGKIPTLITENGPVSEVGAILLYLAQKHQALVPEASDSSYPQFLKWLFYLSNSLHPDLIMHFYLHRYGNAAAQATMRAAVIGRLKAHYEVINTMIAQTRPDWLGGDTVSVLDLYMALLLRWSALFPQEHKDWFTLSDWPELQKIAARVETRDSAKRAQEAEGLGPTPFTAPEMATPKEGVVL